MKTEKKIKQEWEGGNKEMQIDQGKIGVNKVKNGGLTDDGQH